MKAFIKQNNNDQQQLPSQTKETESNDMTTDKNSINCSSFVSEKMEGNISVVENEKQNENKVIENTKSMNVKENLTVTVGDTAGCDISEDNDTSSSSDSQSSTSESEFESMYLGENDDVLNGNGTEIAVGTSDGDVLTTDVDSPISLK